MVTHRVTGYQPDLLDPLHDVIDGGVGGGEDERHVRVASVRIHDDWSRSAPVSQQADEAFWMHYLHVQDIPED